MINYDPAAKAREQVDNTYLLPERRLLSIVCVISWSITQHPLIEAWLTFPDTNPLGRVCISRPGRYRLDRSIGWLSINLDVSG
jgi:hypothetical protein